MGRDERDGQLPGQPWLWLYTLWYQVPGWTNSANIDMIAIYMTGCPSGPGQGPRRLPRGQPSPVEHEPAQRIGDEQRDPGTPGHRGADGQRVDDHGDLVARRRDRLTRAIQPDRYPSARRRADDAGRGRGGQHAELLAAPRVAPARPSLPEMGHAAVERPGLNQHGHSRARGRKSSVRTTRPGRALLK